MTDAVETMAYNKVETPWHGLGNAVNNNLTPAEMLKAAGLNWKVSKEPIFHKKDGKYEEINGKYALTRDKDGSVLSIVGETYKPVQNEEAFTFFKRFVREGHMKMETAGSLWNGRYVWGLARLEKDFEISKGDEQRGYLLLSSPHVIGKSMVIQFTPIRVVCWNTLSWALGSNLKGKAGAFRMPHHTAFDDTVKRAAEAALGLASEQMANYKEAVTLLAKKKAKPEAVEEFFCEILEFDPKAARKKKSKKEEIVEPRMLPHFRNALTHAPGHDLASALGTWWGAVNAVTYVVDHEIGRDRNTALKTAWFGHKAQVKRRAFDLALQRAK